MASIVLYIAIVPSLAKFAVNNGTSLVSSSRPVYPVYYYLHLVDCLARSFRSTRAIRSMPPAKKLGTTFYSLELNVSFLIIFNIDQNAFVYSGQMILAYN